LTGNGGFGTTLGFFCTNKVHLTKLNPLRKPEFLINPYLRR
jgi:hypothetical protein